MSILTSILIALIAVNGSNISLNDLNIDKSHYFADLEKAKTNQNDYCLSFIKNLESQNKIEDCSNITVLTHGLGSSYKDWLPLYNNNDIVDSLYYSIEDFALPFALSNLVNKAEAELAILSPGLIFSNQVQFDYYCEAIEGLIEGRKFNLNGLSTDRNNQDHYRIAFDEPSNTFGFYAAVQNITSGSKNKGRICIGDITIYA